MCQVWYGFSVSVTMLYFVLKGGLFEDFNFPRKKQLKVNFLKSHLQYLETQQMN